LPSAWYRFRASISTRAPGQLAVAFGECDRTIRLPRADSAAPDRVPIFERGATRRLSDAFPSSNPQNQPKPRPEVTERGGAQAERRGPEGLPRIDFPIPDVKGWWTLTSRRAGGALTRRVPLSRLPGDPPRGPLTSSILVY
jgi:hypothetical protein